MAYKYIAQIPLTSIDRIELYINTNKKTVAQIKAERGCQYVLNGGLFNMSTFEQYCNVKSNGRIYYDPKYNEYGMTWNTNDIAMKLIPDTARSNLNWIGMKALCYQNKVQPVNDKDSGIGGKRGRSAIALKAGYLVLYCTKDGSSYAKFPSQLCTELMGIGCTDILMLDGGGSSQCDFNGNKITSSRKVANLILVYTKKVSIDTIENSMVTPAPVTMTPTVGTINATSLNVRSGPGTKYTRVGTLKKNTKITVTGKTVDGSWYRFASGWVSATYVYLDKNKVFTGKCPYTQPVVTLRYGSRGDNVKWLQWYLKNKFGYDLAIDGSYGPATKRAVIDFQQRHGLEDDGVAGKLTKNAILDA